MKKWGKEVEGKEYGILLPVGQCSVRESYSCVNPQCETPDIGSPRVRTGVSATEVPAPTTGTQPPLRPSLPLENLLCLLVLTVLSFWKPEMSSACTPGRKSWEGDLCKWKFVTVGRTVALQPVPISGFSASQPHCKVLQVLPPPRHIYTYIKNNPLSISQYTKGPHHTAKIAVPTLVN